ncbi:hypothetical protein [Halarchaeum sp. P4]|uniref:hypothetical protein n=1 Tax=Halarchaeum sp. P4 TaxID=3421639 RepID=UPI003EBA737D
MSPQRVTDWLVRTVAGPGRVRLAAIFLVAPLLGVVTAAANTLAALPFLLFPPLAAVSYSLFTRETRSVAWDVPVALTVGACSGWLAAVLVGAFRTLPSHPYTVSPLVVVFTVVFAGVSLWALNIEVPPAFAVGLLLPFAGVSPGVYVANVVAASTFVIAVHAAYRGVS